MIDFIGECGDADCTAAISLTESEYEQIRAEPVLSSRSFRVTRFPRSKTSCPRAIASKSFASTTRKRTSPERPTLGPEGVESGPAPLGWQAAGGQLTEMRLANSEVFP